MKKIGIFCAALLALGFASCDDKSDLGIAQTNPQETVMSAGGVTVNYGTGISGQALDLNNYIAGDKNTPIPVIVLEEAKDLPEGATISYTMQLADNAAFDNAAELPVTNGTVDAKAWDDWFRATLGKSPAAKSNWVRFAAYINYNGQLSRVATEDTWFLTKELTVTPVPLDITIEEHYYLIGTLNDWGLNDLYPFSHNDAMSVYDDSNFTITVEISEEQAAAGWWWKIAPLSAVENNDWNAVVGTVVDGDTALEGKLTDTDAKAGCINEAGTFLMTINMMDMTYKFEKMEYMYTPGNSNGWNQGDSQKLVYDAASKTYSGFVYLDGEFKFTSAPDWNGTNYGNSGEDGVLSTDPGAGNLTAEKGLYYVVVDTNALTYTLTSVTTWGAIGGFNAWGASIAFTPSADMLVWKGDVTFAADTDEWKFRANDDWAINLGGEASHLVLDGGNLLPPGIGTYEVTLDLSNVPYSCSWVKK